MTNRIVLLLILLLSGCASQLNKGDCKLGKGSNCKSVTEVNNMVTRGELESLEMQGLVKFNQPKLVIKKVPTQLKNDIVRKPEKTARIWVNGFEDELGDYVKETDIYTVLEGGIWANVQ